jgi:hypothetical protein
MKTENPDLKVTEGAKLNGAAWAKMDEEARKPFEKMKDLDRDRYDRQLEEIDEKDKKK